MCVASLNQLDNCWSFRVFNIFQNMFEHCCIFLICEEIISFVSRFTSILMLEGSQLRWLNDIPLLYVYLSHSKKKWWECSHDAPQLQEAFDYILTLHQS
jgi:hypothetical protein